MATTDTAPRRGSESTTSSNDNGVILARLLDKVQKEPDGCWSWTGYKNGNGYGRIAIEGISRYAHRVSYELLVGPIPVGFQIDHLCRNRGCCNPEHLEAVTPAENTRRGLGHGTEQSCPKGHPYLGKNLYIHTDKRGQKRRLCRACKSENRQVKT